MEPVLAPHLTCPDIDRPFSLVLLHTARVASCRARIFTWPVWGWTPEDFTLEFTHMSCCSALLCSVGTPAAAAKDSFQVLPEGNGSAEEREEGLPVVSCLEAETEGRDQATLAETSHKSVWRPFYLSALPQLLPALLSYGSILSAILTSRRSRNHFCVEGG